MKIKSVILGLVVCLAMAFLLSAIPVSAEVTPWPPDGFWNYPYDPSTFDRIAFGLYG